MKKKDKEKCNKYDEDKRVEKMQFSQYKKSKKEKL